MLVGYQSSDDDEELAVTESPSHKRQLGSDELNVEESKPADKKPKIALPGFENGETVARTASLVKIDEDKKKLSGMVPPQLLTKRKNVSTEDHSQWNTKDTAKQLLAGSSEA